MSTSRDGIVEELELFAGAANWKTYMARSLAPFICGDVAEVGAGIGGTTQILAGVPGIRTWLAIEPDEAMIAQLQQAIAQAPVPAKAQTGVLADLPREPSFDTIVYIDVLEHIEHDSGELADAFARLRPGGRIVVLCPAWPRLYTPFDRAIGHFRRYTKASLRAVAVDGMVEKAAYYLDAVGVLASLANKVALRQSMPTAGQVRLWDRLMIPLSQVVDPLIGRTLGKSIVVVWSDR